MKRTNDPRTSACVIINQSTGAVLADRAEVANSFLKRMVGLLSRASLGEGEALLFPRCNSIHTCFMRFSIDVVFLDQGRAIKIIEQMPPFQFAWAQGADTVLELPPGTLSRTRTQMGARVIASNHAD